jgi:hypothetical protein
LQPRPFFMPLFSGVRGRGILGSSPPSIMRSPDPMPIIPAGARRRAENRAGHPSGLRPLRYHASRGDPSGGEEVRDGPHNHNSGGGNCSGVAPTTVPLLMPRAGALRGPGPSLCQGSSAVGRVTPRLVERSIQAKLRSGFHPLCPFRVFSLATLHCHSSAARP